MAHWTGSCSRKGIILTVACKRTTNSTQSLAYIGTIGLAALSLGAHVDLFFRQMASDII